MKPGTRKAKRGKADRKCLRCGCTERRACGCGCCWVVHSDVCSACLTDGEYAVWNELTAAFLETKSPEGKKLEDAQQEHFRKYLNATSMRRPFPRRLTPGFQEELATLKADRKYPEIKPQYDVLHERPTAEQANRHPRGRNSL